jgi:archaellum component FlaC
MKRTVQNAVILAIGAIFVISLFAGCQEQQATDAKKGRLVAAENIGLKKELDRRDREIERLKGLHSKEIKRQEELVAKCLEEKGLLQKRVDENIKAQVSEVLAAVIEENSKLHDEIEGLKTQVQKLQAELAELKTKPK